MELIAFLIGITILGLLAQFWGADTRSLGDWQPRPEDWALPSRRPATPALAAARGALQEDQAGGGGSEGRRWGGVTTPETAPVVMGLRCMGTKAGTLDA